MSIEQPPDTQPMLVICNTHAPASGTPPALGRHDEDDNRYISYFENQHGEQAVFAYDLDLDAATLTMGDADWDNVILNPTLTITTKSPNGIPIVRPADDDDDAKAVILNQPEATWLSACLAAITPMRRHAACRKGLEWEDTPELRKRLFAELTAEIRTVPSDTSYTGLGMIGALHAVALIATELQCRGELSAANLVREQFTLMVESAKAQAEDRAARKRHRTRRAAPVH